MTILFRRDALSRAALFIKLARACDIGERDEYEACLEASIVFGRAALQQLPQRYGRHPGWNAWWSGLLHDDSVTFIRRERDHILKVAPAKVNQVIRVGSLTTRADAHYYFHAMDESASTTIERHLHRTSDLVREASERFGAAFT